eukprot:1927369-Prymnesium_polylepis.1
MDRVWLVVCMCVVFVRAGWVNSVRVRVGVGYRPEVAVARAVRGCGVGEGPSGFTVPVVSL